MLMYPDHLENWLDFGHHLLIFLILAPFWLRETGQMCSFLAFSWQCMKGMCRNLSCSSPPCDMPRNEKGKFELMIIIQLPSGGYPWLLCIETFLVFFLLLLLSPCKTIAFHNTTKGGCLSARIVITITKSGMTISSQKLCFESRRKCGVGFIHTQLVSSYANAPQQLASSPSTVGFITRNFHALISRQYSQTNRRGLHTLFLTSKSRCMQKISSVDALLTIQNVLSWSGRFGGGHTGWSQLQLASSVSPLWTTAKITHSYAYGNIYRSYRLESGFKNTHQHTSKQI